MRVDCKRAACMTQTAIVIFVLSLSTLEAMSASNCDRSTEGCCLPSSARAIYENSWCGHRSVNELAGEAVTG